MVFEFNISDLKHLRVIDMQEKQKKNPLRQRCLTPLRLFSDLAACSQHSDEDVSQFDTRFTRQTPVDSPDDTSLSHSAELAFAVRLPPVGLPSYL